MGKVHRIKFFLAIGEASILNFKWHEVKMIFCRWSNGVGGGNPDSFENNSGTNITFLEGALASFMDSVPLQVIIVTSFPIGQKGS